MTEPDNLLIQQFHSRRSEEAFAALVRQHINLVFATAVRQLGDRGAAEEVTQNVFIALAQNAGKLGGHPTIAGWLYQTTINKSKERLRAELRRQRRENRAVNLELANKGESVWAGLVPLLDEALLQLREQDRLAVVLRYLEGRTFGEVGSVLGVGEDAARKRVDRCLDELTAFFQKRGFAVPSLAANASLFALASHSAPPALARAITAASGKGSAALTLKGALKFMAWTKAQTAVVAGVAVVLAAGTAVVVMKETQMHRGANWQEKYDAALLERMPPQITILPSLPSTVSSALHGMWQGRSGKTMGLGQSIPDILMVSYYPRYHLSQLSFYAEVPQGRYDFLATLPGGRQAEQQGLREELQRKFGLVGRPQTMEADCLVLRVKSPGALKRAAGDFSGTEQPDSYLAHNQPLWPLVDYLSEHLRTVVVDETKLTGNYDIDFKWDKTPEGLKQTLLEQTGLELVLERKAIEFLLVEDVNHPLVGIGASLAPDESGRGVKITQVFPNSPAAEGGLTAGCVIQRVDGISMVDIKLAQCVNLLRGAAGTTVKVEFITPDGAQTNAVELVRRQIQLPGKQ
jgi:uncharacterized protein (TIGR03435 family)